jgi:hypothetical protein
MIGAPPVDVFDPLIRLRNDVGTNNPATRITPSELREIIKALVTIFFTIMTLKILPCGFYYFLRPALLTGISLPSSLRGVRI